MDTFRELVYSSFTLSTEIDKVKFIIDYIINNVSFNYAGLLKSLLFDNIDNYYEVFNVSNKEEAKTKLRITLENISKDIFSDEELKNKSIDKIMDAIDKVEFKPNIYQMLGKVTKEINNPTYAPDGRLLKEGVCEDISDFIHDYFNCVGIQSDIVIGYSHSNHKWIRFFIEGIQYHMDLTDSIYIRDKSYKLNGNIEDYFYMSLEDLFRLDPNRRINIIGHDYCEPAITVDNYNSVIMDGGRMHV